VQLLTLWPWSLTFQPQNHSVSRISQSHSLYQVWTLWDHSSLSYAADRQTDRQTELNVLPTPTDSWIVFTLLEVALYKRTECADGSSTDVEDPIPATDQIRLQSAHEYGWTTLAVCPLRSSCSAPLTDWPGFYERHKHCRHVPSLWQRRHGSWHLLLLSRCTHTNR